VSEKPSYLGLLNAISVAESEAECYLNAWAEVTRDDAVRQVIATVALREGEHGKAFAKRICELGYAVLPRVADDAAEKLRIASSTEISDRRKFELLKLGQAPADPDADDVFARMFRDKTIDIATGALLGRYIAEERDSGRLLSGCYRALCAQEAAAAPAAATSGGLEDRLARIECLLEQLVGRLQPAG
jgi:hypothetical protein